LRFLPRSRLADSSISQQQAAMDWPLLYTSVAMVLTSAACRMLLPKPRDYKVRAPRAGEGPRVDAADRGLPAHAPRSVGTHGTHGDGQAGVRRQAGGGSRGRAGCSTAPCARFGGPALRSVPLRSRPPRPCHQRSSRRWIWTRRSAPALASGAGGGAVPLRMH
jgi:hypothetical protein